MDVDTESSTSVSQDRLRYEEERLSTFTDWPISFISAKDLAHEGFYYTHVKDLCACAFCGGIHGNWTEGDTPRGEHERLHPDCKFLQGRVVSNVPLIQEKRLVQNLRNIMPDVVSPLTSSDICGTGKLSKLQEYNSHEDLLDENMVDIDYNSRLKTFSSTDSLWYEDVRLSTFIDWPVEFISVRDLARDGFYYLRKKDHCACAFCRIIIGAWEEGDVPREEHKKHFPYCPFIRGEITPNVPLTQCVRAQVSKDISIFPSSASTGKLDKLKDYYSQEGEPNKSSGTKLSVSSLGFNRYCGPKVEAYVTVEARIHSFKQWPDRVKQTSQELAEAGFYHCGLSDHVRCFHCGIGIRNWEAEDRPWKEHAKWSPNCHFVLLMKGIEYVLKVQKKNQHASQKSSHDQHAHQVNSQGCPSELNLNNDALENMMEDEIVKQVLEMRFPRNIVKKALKQKLMLSGQSFSSVEACANAVLSSLSQGSSFQDESASTASSQDVSSSFTTSSLSQDVSQSSIESTSVSSSSTEDDSVSIELSTSVSSGISSSSSSLSESLSLSSEESSVCRPSGKTITSKLHQEAKKMINLLRPSCLKKLDTETVVSEEQPIDKLALELQKMKEGRICKVCLDKEMDVAFLPCRHMATCGSCAAALDACPVCRRNIQYAFQIICS